ncbi:PleD family two-component system response regulator [Candidatus Omnitrophota bacterium]
MLNKIKELLGINPKLTSIKENAKKKILCVDDNEIDRKIIEKILRSRGYQFEVAVDGEEGYAKALSFKPDLILLDFDMPKVTGYDMCMKIKENPETEGIPVLFLSSTTSTKEILDCFEAEAENCLSKPVNPTVLSVHIQDILKDYEEK